MEPQVWYLDQEHLNQSAPTALSDRKIIPAGKYIQPSYPGCEVTALDRIFSEQYDFHLCFPKELPQFSFYPVPELLVFAIDSHGGSFVSTNRNAKLEEVERADIYYLDRTHQLHWIAPSWKEFLSVLVFTEDWKRGFLEEASKPEPSEKARIFLINTFQLSPPDHSVEEPERDIHIFSSLAAAREALPFLDLPG